MKITLLVLRLDFVSLGTPKLHARDQEDQIKATMCGKPLWSGAEILPQRTLGSDKLCRRCYASLATYSGRLGSTPKVRIEREVPA
ncbi:MAG TPA: hypothetical protein VFK47_14505 [Ktedonobacteraceae bacterium]|nr:hypothetical protein [Ktedonobacteraceae bacterium]